LIKLTKAERELLSRVPKEEFGVMLPEDQRAVWALRREGEELVEYRQRGEKSGRQGHVVTEWRLTKLGREVLG
jgi:hypothetical protein